LIRAGRDIGYMPELGIWLCDVYGNNGRGVDASNRYHLTNRLLWTVYVITYSNMKNK